MDLKIKNAGSTTPTKNPQPNRSNTPQIAKSSENSNPNVNSPASKSAKSPAIKSATKKEKSPSKNPNHKIRERKFVVVKRNSKREKSDDPTAIVVDSQKSISSAYESLRASHEEFFKNFNGVEEEEEGEEKPSIQTLEIGDGVIGSHPVEIEQSGEMGSCQIKKRSGSEHGGGKVMNLVKAFERLLTMPKDLDQKDDRESGDDKLDQKDERESGDDHKEQVASSSFCSPEFLLTSESLGLNSRASSSSDSSHGSFTFSSKTSVGGRKSRRNSFESSGTFCGIRRKKRQLKSTSQRPFKLQTEERGRFKEEEFIKKVQQIMTEEEKQRIPIAQGLPWTTDEPECLIKPPVKEITRPVDLMLHSDVRAVERTEFDQQVAGKMSLIEQYKMQRERQQQLAEEEEIRRLRKELVPRAQPMPYFDRPFVPKRSLKHPTVPREPKLYNPEHKKIKCGVSC